MDIGIRCGSWLGGPLLERTLKHGRLFRAAAVVPKIDSREPVWLDRKSPAGRNLSPLEAASLFSSSTRLSSRFSLPGRPDISQLHQDFPALD